MLTYLIIILDDTSVSFCHYNVERTERRLIDIDDLKAGILFAMKENLNVQFVYPNFVLPQEYKDAIETIDHIKIGPTSCGEDLDMTIVDELGFDADKKKAYLWHCSLEKLISEKENLVRLLPQISRLNVVLTDIPKWNEDSLDTYKETLEFLTDKVADYYKQGISVQMNLITDRFMLGKMNNCNAGDTSITLAPDGKYYVCPAYYPGISVGNLKDGISIPNKQLYRIDHSPICSRCDAYQCKRCIWMNEEITLECNTPSHEQCVTAHLERNATRKFLGLLEKAGVKLENFHGIEEIDYLDPFNIIDKWKQEKL
ncbi:MAG: CXXX repeat peptide maturase [Prevotella sp.]|nr:CXXX repeat peptide maturase [Prevotella sp.]